MKRRAFLALAALAWSGLCAAADEAALLQQLAARLEFHQGVEGEFRQEKHLHFMHSPFVSTGRFALRRDGGLEWHVTDPVESRMTIRGSQVLLDGQPVNDRGVGALMARIMRGFMRGDLADLAAGFEVAGDVTADHWQLQLSPVNPLLGQVLAQIRVAGDAYLDCIEVLENSGTRTLISFSNVRDTDSAQSPESG